MSTALLVRKSDLAISFTEEALALKREALEAAALIGKVANGTQQEVAVAAQQKLKHVISLYEKARTAAKAPLLEAGRKLDETVKRESLELENEWGRLADMVGEFQRAEMRRVSEERERQRLELERIEREKAEALKAAATPEEKQAVEERAAMQSAVTEQPIAPVKAKGQVVSEDWEITILNPYELAKFHPDCVNITPRLSDIKARLNQGMPVKGVKAERILKSGVRTTKQAVIELEAANA